MWGRRGGPSGVFIRSGLDLATDFFFLPCLDRYLIEKAVDTSKADYAVFTGVQIHNWASDLEDPNTPSIEFVSVGKSYVVVDGEKSYLDLHKVPALSPRMLRILSK